MIRLSTLVIGVALATAMAAGIARSSERMQAASVLHFYENAGKDHCRRQRAER